MKRTKIIAILTLIIGTSLIVSAGLLNFYAKVDVTANVQQSVVVSDIGPAGEWYDYTHTFDRPLGEVFHCTDYTYKYWIKNQACGPAEIEITDTWTQYPGTQEGFDINHYVFGDNQTINFYKKDPITWKKIGEDSGFIEFRTCSNDFDSWFLFRNGEPVTEYALIYYFDTDPRYDEWGGEGGLILHTFTTNDSGGYFVTSLVTDIPTIPFETDWNAGPEADYCVSDGYEHCKGAKLWIVPTADLTNGNSLPLIEWNPETYFFEDDLILYIDCEDTTPIWLPHVYPLFDTTTLQPDNIYCWLSCYHTAINIMPGAYSFQTKLIPIV